MSAKVIIFSGAGLSASSGISTFRERDGLWEKHDINEICMAGCLEWNYDNTIAFYNKRREDIKDKHPNAAHKMIAELKEKFPQHIEVITQNVDDLLEKAGCQEVLHLHGFLKELRCMQCETVVSVQYEIQTKENATCNQCGAKLRPNTVFFGEPAPLYEKLYEKLQSCGLLVVIGTSGNVIDVNYLSQYADVAILNNLEKSDAIYEECFEKIYYEDAVTASKKIEHDILNYIENGTL